jgi:GNAT superfamily N-acetyltransferase
MTKLSEIIAIPLQEKFRRESFAIHDAKQAPGQVNSDQPLRFGLKGDSDPGEFKPGVAYKFWGVWEQNDRFGPSLKFNSFSPATPHGKHGIVSYLKQAKNIGDAIAFALWESFSGEAVKVLREEPERASEAVGKRFPVEKAREAAADLEVLKAAENITIELIDLLEGRGFGRACIRQALKTWGAQAVSVLRRDPHKAMALRGVGFKKADAFYLDLGKPPDKLKRQAYSVWYSATKEAEQAGHVWVSLDWAIAGLKATVAGANVAPEKALALATRGKLVVTRTDDKGVVWVADIRKANAERYVAERIIDMMYASQVGPPIGEWEDRTETVMVKPDHTRCTRCHRKLTAAEVWILDGKPFGPDCIEKVNWGDGIAEQFRLEDWLSEKSEIREVTTQHLTGVARLVSAVEWPEMESEIDARSEEWFGELTDHQRQELAKAMSGPIGVLSGRPGTGKSFTLVRLLKALIALHGNNQIRVMAPTGKAAQRVKELMQEAGVSGVEPTTIHRGLGVESADDGWSFKHNEHNPLPCKYLIIEEASMLGLGLFRSVLAALARGTGLLLVGDVNQLPPVEYGAPLRDMIAAGLPHGEFTQIMRNSGAIVRTCSAIVDGQSWQPKNKIDLKAEDPVNLCLIQTGKHQAAQKILQLVQQLKDHSPWNPIDDVQIVVAVNKRSALSRVDLNKQLQDLLNPGTGPQGCPFRLNDKIIQLKNSFLPSAQPKEAKEGGGGKQDWAPDQELKHLVCNGEIGRVVWLSCDGKKIVCRFPSPERTVMVFRAGAKAENGENDGGEEKPETGCDLDLAYAVTCHKMQGSQTKIIIVALDEYPGASGQYGVCDRAWLYTAISRAQKATFLVGLKHVADAICSKRFVWRRKTFMVEILRGLAEKAGLDLGWGGEPGGPSLESLFKKPELTIVNPDDMW